MEEEKLEQTSDAPQAESEQSVPESQGVAQEGQQELAQEPGQDEADLILEDHRKRYPDLPSKFKRWSDVIKWGSEAEKAKSRAESEKGEHERRARELTELIGNLSQQKKEETGKSMTDEEKLRIRAQYEDDPIGTLNRMFEEFERKLEGRRQRETQEQRWLREEEEISKSPEYKDKWESEVLPALLKISKERPHLQSIDEVLSIYERQKGREAQKLRAESEAKKTEKKAAFVEGSTSMRTHGKSLQDKIAGAKSMDDLRRLESSLK